MAKTFEIKIWGGRNCNKIPVIVMTPRKNARRKIIVEVGCAWGHWQTAMKEGRTLLAKVKSEA